VQKGTKKKTNDPIKNGVGEVGDMYFCEMGVNPKKTFRKAPQSQLGAFGIIHTARFGSNRPSHESCNFHLRSSLFFKFKTKYIAKNSPNPSSNVLDENLMPMRTHPFVSQMKNLEMHILRAAKKHQQRQKKDDQSRFVQNQWIVHVGNGIHGHELIQHGRCEGLGVHRVWAVHRYLGVLPAVKNIDAGIASQIHFNCNKPSSLPAFSLPRCKMLRI